MSHPTPTSVKRDIHSHFPQSLVWDDYRLPDSWWKNVERDGDHWLTQVRGYYPYAFLCRRLLDLPWVMVLAIVPTCGHERCVNPSHLCVTLKDEASLVR